MLRYLTRFRCIESRCEDSCCNGLQITLTAKELRRLREKTADAPLEQARFEKQVQLLGAATTASGQPTTGPNADAATENEDSGHATLTQGDACTFLEPSGLCRLQRKWGESALPDTCSVFPRQLAKVHDSLEVCGTLACPEVARLCLLEADAVEFVPLEPGVLPRLARPRTLKQAPGDLYVESFDDIRRATFQILEQRKHPIAQRLFFLSALAHNVSGFFQPGASLEHSDRLKAEIDNLASPEAMEELSGVFARVVHSPVRVAHVMKEVLLARLLKSQSERFQVIVRPTILMPGFRTAAEWETYFQGNTEVLLPDELLAERYDERAAILTKRFGPRIEQYFNNFVMNHLEREWYVTSPSWMEHLQTVVFLTTAARFLLVLHPRLAPFLKHDASALTEAVLDSAAVEVFQAVSKNLEHVPAYLQLVGSYLKEQGLQSLPGFALLLKF